MSDAERGDPAGDERLDSPEEPLLYVLDDALEVVFVPAGQPQPPGAPLADVLRRAVAVLRAGSGEALRFEARAVRAERLLAADGSEWYAVLLERFPTRPR